LNSCLYQGWVRHRRFAPFRHEFRYRLTQPLLDLGELDRVFAGSRLWSVEGRTPASFQRRDHLGDPAVPLDRAVRDLVAERLGRRPAGPIRLLTHPRYFGYVMNPVSFYYCYDAGSGAVDAIVAEVHNTPWGERHCYVLDARAGARFRFGKAFHVSPFLPMDLGYDWRLPPPGATLTAHLAVTRAGRPAFDATMVLKRRPITPATLRATLVRHPLMTGKVIGAIYWQALRLWLRGAPVHDHPREAA
jgi:uncharacterized protein